jgi:TolB-like protein
VERLRPKDYMVSAFLARLLSSPRQFDYVPDLAVTNQTKLAVILHADVVGSTALVQKDEQLAHDRIQEAFHRFSNAISAAGGRAHEIRGDAIVAEFDRASDAANAAVSFQAANFDHNTKFEDEIRPELRVGIALGEVVIADATVTGGGVVLAQRLEQLAAPGGICISAAVKEALPTRLPLQFEDFGEQVLKGFAERVRAYSVSAATPPSTSSLASVPSMTQRPDSVLSGAVGPTVAVLPFVNLSRDADQDFFADGVTSDITQALSASKSFPVLANSSTNVYKGKDIDTQIAGTELGARYVVSGSVRRAGDKVRVSVELADVETRVQLWSERYDHRLEDVFAVQDEITTTVASVVQPEIDIREMQRISASPPSVMGAYDKAQRGYWYLWKTNRDDYLESIRLFQEALELDAMYARAYAGQAQGKYNAGLRSWEERTSAYQGAKSAAQAALDIDDKNPVAMRYFGGALANLGKLDEALEPLRKSVTLYPSYATAYSALAFLLNLLGRFEEAIESEATTARLRPRDPGMHICMLSRSIAKYFQSDFAEAENVARRSIAINDSMWLGQLMLAAALGKQNRASDAASAVEKLHQLLPGLTAQGVGELMPFRSGEHLEEIMDGLRRSGLNLR